MRDDITSDTDRTVVAEIGETELEAIAAGLPVHTGMKAGITPCI